MKAIYALTSPLILLTAVSTVGKGETPKIAVFGVR